VPALSDEVGDHPVVFPKLQIFHPNTYRFGAAKRAAKKYGRGGKKGRIQRHGAAVKCGFDRVQP
jgi:hypothetical protein